MRCLSGLLALFAAVTVLTIGVAASTLRLGPGDSVSLKVLERAEMSDVYFINPDRSFVIPGLGPVKIGNGTLSDIEQAVADLIETRLGLGRDTFSVAIETLRPVVVGGAVARPGEYPFVLGATVAHAISMAGGPRLALSENPLEAVELGRERDRLSRERDGLAVALVLRERLIHELEGEILDSAPQEATRLVGALRLSAILTLEKNIAERRARSHQLELARIKDRRAINSDGVAAQESVTRSLREQLELFREELETLKPLAERGGVTMARMLDLRRNLVETEGRLGEATGTLSQAQIEGTGLASQSQVLELARSVEILGALTETETAIVRSRNTIDEIVLALDDAAVLMANRPGDRGGSCTVQVVQTSADGTEVVEVDGMTRLNPGDLVFVERRHADCQSIISASDGQVAR